MAKLINSTEFKEQVLNSTDTILVDFSAEWCGPCKMLAPVLDELGTELGSKAKIYKVDVDNSSDLARQYGIMGVPTMLFFKGGKLVDKVVGFQPKEVIKSKLV